MDKEGIKMDAKLPEKKFAQTFVYRCRVCKKEDHWPPEVLHHGLNGASECLLCSLTDRIKQGDESAVEITCHECRMAGKTNA